MNVYDQGSRLGIKLDLPGFLAWQVRGLDPDLHYTRWLETQSIPFPGEADRRCDTVAELEHASGLQPPWALVIEAQTQPDPDIFERLLEYLARVRRQLRHGPYGKDKYLVAAALINLTGVTTGSGLTMVLPGQSGVKLDLQVSVRQFEQIDAAATLAEIERGETARCLLPWIPLMQGGGQEAIIETWKRLAEQEPDSRRRAEYGGLALVFAELRPYAAAWKKGLEGWNVQESQIVKEWREEGRKEGLMEGERRALLRVLRIRFVDPLPTEIVQGVQAQTDINTLSNWQQLAVTAASLDQFRQAVGM
jgi:hypothetical protein